MSAIKYLFTKTSRLTYVAVCFLAVLGCENNFDQINTDPNAFTDAPTHLFLPGSIATIALAENNYFDGYLYPSLWIQQTTLGTWDQPGSYFYEPVRSQLWGGLYRGPLTDIDFMLSRTEEEENESLNAVGKILKAYSFTLLVNAFGDVPYTDSFKVDEGLNQPVYDEQSVVFDAILQDLRDANDQLSGRAEIDIPEKAKFDLIYRGDAVKWRKFANSLRFRLLIQLSDIRDVSSEISTISPLFESSDDNANYTFTDQTIRDVFPQIAVVGGDPGHRMAEPLVDRMLQTEDPRLPVYALVNNDGEYVGANAGELFQVGNNFSPLNPINFTDNETVPFMNYNELLFLRAEAAAKGLVSGDESNLLANAVATHMRSYEIPDEDIVPYVDALTDNGTNLNEIYTEKWVSMFRRGMQAWVDYRRTGVPTLSPNPTGRVNIIPRRFSYPDDEYRNNRTNLETTVQKLSNGDDLDSGLIWTIN